MRVREETHRFLSHVAPWRYFVTLTHARDVSDRTVLRAFRDWARDVAKGGGHMRIGWIHAPQARDVLHVHALLAPHEADLAAELHELHEADLARAWTRGSVNVQTVTEPCGAAAYLLTHTNLTAADIRRAWDLNVACDGRSSCRRPGRSCRFAPGPWST